MLLLGTAIVALVWANSAWHESYEHLWETPLTIGIGGAAFTRSLHFWINDGLMAVFFLVVGLEIKRELVHGALAEIRRAALPVAAALGGMAIPAALYLAINLGRGVPRGWGVPMATDIAFAVGVLALLGRRVPAAMRVLLLTVAIVDDIGAILVIALFYSAGLSAVGVLWATAGALLLIALPRFGVRPGWLYALPFALLWAGCYQAGVHPTIAGVIAGLATPARSWLSRDQFVAVAREAVEDFERRSAHRETGHELLLPLNRLAFAQREAIAPALRLEIALHPWVAYGIMPLFALANAGVRLDGVALEGPIPAAVFAGVVAGLVVGKPVGILLAAWLAVRAGVGALPHGLGWRHLTVLGLVAGIGFTMAIFIAELGFGGTAQLGVAKLAVLAGTALAGAGALSLGRFWLPLPRTAAEEPDEADVESSSAHWSP